jgi:hypothetical protein
MRFPHRLHRGLVSVGSASMTGLIPWLVSPWAIRR